MIYKDDLGNDIVQVRYEIGIRIPNGDFIPVLDSVVEYDSEDDILNPESLVHLWKEAISQIRSMIVIREVS